MRFVRKGDINKSTFVEGKAPIFSILLKEDGSKLLYINFIKLNINRMEVREHNELYDVEKVFPNEFSITREE